MPEYRNMTAKEAIRAAYYDRAFPDCCQSVLNGAPNCPLPGWACPFPSARGVSRSGKRKGAFSAGKGPFL